MAAEIRHLLSIARIVGDTTDPAEAFRRICRELAAMTGAETVAAYVPGGDGAEIRPIAGYHVPPSMLDVLMTSPLPLSEQGFAASVFGAGRVVWSDDVPGDPRFTFPLFRRFPHQSGLILPLTLDGDVAGAFYLVWWRERRRFHDADVHVLHGIGEMTGALLRHAQLYRQAEERRRQAEASEARFRTLADHIPAGLFQVAPGGRCVAVNAGWCRLTGRPPEDAETLGWLCPIHPEDRARVEDAWTAAMRDGREFTMDFRLETAAGATITVSTGAVPIRDAHGAVEGYLGTLTDITERQQLRDAEQIRAVAQLALAAAHEINNPLAIIMANLELLSAQGDSPHQERIDRTLAAVRRVRDVVGRMSAVTRIERVDPTPGRPEMIDIRKSSPDAPSL